MKQNGRLLHKNETNGTTNTKLISNAGSNKMFRRIAYALISVLKNVKILFIKNILKLLNSVNVDHASICKCLKE